MVRTGRVAMVRGNSSHGHSHNAREWTTVAGGRARHTQQWAQWATPRIDQVHDWPRLANRFIDTKNREYLLWQQFTI